MRDKEETVILNKSINMPELPPEAYKELEDFIEYLRKKYNNKKNNIFLQKGLAF